MSLPAPACGRTGNNQILLTRAVQQGKTFIQEWEAEADAS